MLKSTPTSKRSPTKCLNKPQSHSRSITTSTKSLPTSALSLPHHTSNSTTSPSTVNTQSTRSFHRQKIRLVRRGAVTDRRPNLRKKGIENQLAETIFLASPLSYVKPENSLHDQFLRIRLQHWDQFRTDNPEKELPETPPYTLDRFPGNWPEYHKYCKDEAEKGPLIFYRKSHLRYDEPSFVHVVNVKDKVRQNGFGRTTVLTAWHTWRGVTHPFPKQVASRRKHDWRRLPPQLGFMTVDLWKKLQLGEVKPYFLPRPLYLDKSLEADFVKSEEVRHADLIESTRSKVV